MKKRILALILILLFSLTVPVYASYNGEQEDGKSGFSTADPDKVNALLDTVL